MIDKALRHSLPLENAATRMCPSKMIHEQSFHERSRRSPHFISSYLIWTELETGTCHVQFRIVQTRWDEISYVNAPLFGLDVGQAYSLLIGIVINISA